MSAGKGVREAMKCDKCGEPLVGFQFTITNDNTLICWSCTDRGLDEILAATSSPIHPPTLPSCDARVTRGALQ